MKRFKHPFEPIIDQNSKVLILGTFPSLDSFSNNFYYAHKRNQFWKIIETIFEVKLEDIEEKKKFLLKNHIALWDMIESCERKNSSDANLKNIKLNDIKSLLEKYSNIKTIGFTGKKAEEIYKKNFNLPIKTILLPSPSPTYAKMKFEDKVKQYKKFLRI